MEHHHRIAGDEPAGVPLLEAERKILLQLEFRLPDGRPHLDVVLQGHVGDRVGIGPAALFEFREDLVPRAIRISQTFIEGAAVLERRVHALPVKRNDRVRRIAQDERMILERPGRAADRLQMAGGIFEEVLAEAGHERNRVGESASKSA